MCVVPVKGPGSWEQRGVADTDTELRGSRKTFWNGVTGITLFGWTGHCKKTLLVNNTDHRLSNNKKCQSS